MMQVCVPPDWARPWSDGTAPDMPSSTPHDTEVSRAISVLEATAAALERRAEAAEQRADAADARADRAEATRARERTRAEALRDRMDVLQIALDQAQRDAQAARDKAEASQTGHPSLSLTGQLCCRATLCGNYDYVESTTLTDTIWSRTARLNST